MGRVEDLIARVEVKSGNNRRRELVEPQVRRFYQKDGVWYAVVQIIAGGNETSMHVALGN